MNKVRLTAFVTITMLIVLVGGCSTNTSNTNSGMSANSNAGASQKSQNASVAKRTITTSSGEQLIIVEPPAEVVSITKTLSAGKAKDFKVERSQISAEQLRVLDKFASETMGVADCQTLHVNGCNSCCADGVSSSLRVTTCGNFCDKVCGAEPCH